MVKATEQQSCHQAHISSSLSHVPLPACSAALLAKRYTTNYPESTHWAAVSALHQNIDFPHNFFFFLAAPHACGILVPQLWIDLCPLQWKCKVLTTEPPGKFSLLTFLTFRDWGAVHRLQCSHVALSLFVPYPDGIANQDWPTVKETWCNFWLRGTVTLTPEELGWALWPWPSPQPSWLWEREGTGRSKSRRQATASYHWPRPGI